MKVESVYEFNLSLRALTRVNKVGLHSNSYVIHIYYCVFGIEVNVCSTCGSFARTLKRTPLHYALRGKNRFRCILKI